MGVGLVLSGGGARAAYQVGALSAISEISGNSNSSKIDIFTGVSAGAINSTFLALKADNFHQATVDLSKAWSSLTPSRVFRTGFGTMALSGTKWLAGLGGGGLFSTGSLTHLLDTAPLREFLFELLRFETLPALIESKRVVGVGISATNYSSGHVHTFYQAGMSLRPWRRVRRLGIRTELNSTHVMASAAIPMFFPPVKLPDGFYGDGCLRMGTPLSPAIHLGASKIIAIGIRPVQEAEALMPDPALVPQALKLSDVVGAVLNAVFLESLDGDIERVQRINGTLALMDAERRAKLEHPLREIPLLVLRPTRDLGEMAGEELQRMPRLIKYFMRGLGAEGGRGSDLLSYLAFQPSYINRLIKLGMEDTMARASEIEKFMSSAS